MAEDNRNTTITRQPITDDQAYIEGAKQATQALALMESKAEACEREQVSLGHLDAALLFDHESANKESTINQVMDMIGALPPRQAGFVRGILEYADSFMRYGQPNLNQWRPLASMNDEEREHRRTSYIDDMEA